MTQHSHEPGTYEKYVTALNSRRIVAAVIDLWLVPLTGMFVVQAVAGGDGDGRWIPAATWFGVVLVVALPTVLEGWSGRTLGKRLRGLKVVEVAAGGPPSWRQVTQRRSWTFPVLAAPVLPGWFGFVLLAILLTVVLSMSRDRAGRGWPDRVAGTEVTPTGSWTARG